ncbi:MAG TPA: hypothetical protein VGL34_00740 [Steroidobacteraceae bacterium]|jgi:ABC-type uncharacterized transport system fused permease/ATPase subunit
MILEQPGDGASPLLDPEEIAQSGLMPQIGMVSRALWAAPVRNALLLLAVALFLVIVATAYGQIRLNRWPAFCRAGYMVWAAIIYSGSASLLSYWVGRNLIDRNAERYEREADLRGPRCPRRTHAGSCHRRAPQRPSACRHHPHRPRRNS